MLLNQTNISTAIDKIVSAKHVKLTRVDEKWVDKMISWQNDPPVIKMTSDQNDQLPK